MPLDAGTRLGPYEIESPIGAGGMGEVYKARDTRLDRTVAIKVLPEHLATNTELKLRFEREARTVSSLNHPNICTLHDVGNHEGTDYLVMEYLEGETLAERLGKGGLDLDQALDYGGQIAEGLDKAHRAGIVHRDLKPGNVMLTDSGVKLLDFGLAKFVEEQVPSSGDSDAPTQHKDLTRNQAILGTLQYMAPEQLDGKTADARADVFALGAVLYEMLTGRKAFAGDSQAGLISEIMRGEPSPASSLNASVPRTLDRLVQKCMAKPPDDRCQTARDVTTELAWIREHRDSPKAVAPTAGSKRGSLYWLAAGLVAGGIVTVALMSRPSDNQTPLVTRLVIPLPDGQRLVERRTTPIALSPDGRQLVYAAETAAGAHLYLRPLGAFQSTPIAGTEGGYSPFFSPDGAWVGFFTDSELKKVAIAGGVPIPLAPVDPGNRGGSWGPDGAIVYAPSPVRGLMKVSQAGGRPEPLEIVDVTSISHHPQILPGGDTLLFNWSGSAVMPRLAELSGGEASMVDIPSADGTLIPVYVSSGHLLVAKLDGVLDAYAFDAREGRVHGEPVSVLRDVVTSQDYTTSSVGVPYLVASLTGTLAYATGPAGEEFLVRVDLQGNATRLSKANVHAPRLSPDGRRVAYNVTGESVHVYDIDRETSTRLAIDEGALAGRVHWKPDGRDLILGGPRGLYWTAADGSGGPNQLVDLEFNARPDSWSADGRRIAFTQSHPETSQDIWVLPLGGEPIPFLVTPAQEHAADFSPNGRYLAYVSDEAGSNEIYVRRFPDADARWQISADGGTEPVWSPVGDKIFYREGQKMMAVDVSVGDELRAGRPEVLFVSDYATDNGGHPAYDVAPDGQSFVMIQQVREAPLTKIHIVLNWFDELNRLVPKDD